MSDFSNRRKELKFTSTDLKLWRRQHGTEIRHWGHWRGAAGPKCYFLWAARLRTDGRTPRQNDRIESLIDQARALIDTYLDGAGLLCWRETAGQDGYEPVGIPAAAAITSLDDVLYRIDSVIREQVLPGGDEPPPERPPERAIDVERLERQIGEVEG